MQNNLEIVKTLVYGAKMKDQLSKETWLKHGLRTLATHGVASLKAAPLAKSLNVSRGSFYWHFKDISVFRQGVLELWKETSTQRVIADLDTLDTAKERLKTLIECAGQADLALERAVRAWAAQETMAARIVESVDRDRVGYIEQLLLAQNISEHTAPSRAQILYWAYLGQNMTNLSNDEVSNSIVFDEMFTLFLR